MERTMIALWKGSTLALCCAFVACAEGAGTRDAADGTPQDAASPPPASGAPTLRPNGIGDIEVGITLVDATDRAGTAAIDPEANAECRYVTFPTLPEGVSLMVIADTVRRIDVETPDVLTERGAGIGMTSTRVEEIYGAGLERMPHKYERDGEYLVIAGTDTSTRIVLETAADTVRTLRAGLMPEVMWVERCG
jgi:hypothetical protein